MMSGNSLAEYRNKIKKLNQTKKITGAMKLVAASKVRKTQDAVVNGRPFSNVLAEILYQIKPQLVETDFDNIYFKKREVKTVAIFVVSGHRGLCGSLNTKVIKLTEQRVKELNDQGIKAKLVFTGQKAHEYFKRRSEDYDIVTGFDFE
jgi:F-type H+-transporting ATPase subunit gamma